MSDSSPGGSVGIGRSVRVVLTAMIAVAVGVGVGGMFLGLKLLVAIGQMQGRKSYSDDSNRVGRLVTGVLGSFLGRKNG